MMFSTRHCTVLLLLQMYCETFFLWLLVNGHYENCHNREDERGVVVVGVVYESAGKY